MAKLRVYAAFVLELYRRAQRREQLTKPTAVDLERHIARLL